MKKFYLLCASLLFLVGCAAQLKHLESATSSLQKFNESFSDIKTLTPTKEEAGLPPKDVKALVKADFTYKKPALRRAQIARGIDKTYGRNRGYFTRKDKVTKNPGLTYKHIRYGRPILTGFGKGEDVFKGWLVCYRVYLYGDNVMPEGEVGEWILYNNGVIELGGDVYSAKDAQTIKRHIFGLCRSEFGIKRTKSGFSRAHIKVIQGTKPTLFKRKK